MEGLKKSFLVRGDNIVGFSDKNFSTAPIGTVLAYAGNEAPRGYLLANGASYKVADYPNLYAVIGNTYGGDTENFNVPNLVDTVLTMVYIIKAFHTNEGVDSGVSDDVINYIDGEIAEKIDKTDISTRIDSTSTDTQVPSAKAVNDILSTITGITNAKTYYLLSQLGITTPCTIKDIWDKMPSGSVAIVDADSSIVTDLDVIRIMLGISNDNEVYGILTVVKLEQRTTLEFRRARTNRAMIPDTFIGYCKGSDCTSIQWKRMVITSVADVPNTVIVSEDTNVKLNPNCYYTVINGVCYVTLWGFQCTEAGQYVVNSSMPKTRLTMKGLCTYGSNGYEGGCAFVFYDNNGNNKLYVEAKTTEPLYGSFSYPVAE